MESDSPQTFGSRLTSESRRRFLRAVGATTLLAGSGGLAVVAQEGDDANGDGANDDDAGDDDAGDDDAGDDGTDDDRGVETVALDARVDGWRGVVPDPIDGETNPALDVAAGETYRVVWRNDDGEPHNFSVVDEAGGTLPVLRVLDVSSEEAAPVFEASGGTVRTGENLEIVATEDDDDDDRGTDDDDDDEQDDRGTATDDDDDRDDADDDATETGTDDDRDDDDTETATDDDDDDGDDDDDATETGTAGMETGDDVVTGTPADLMTVTETISRDGAIQAVEFEVTEEMAQYQCQVHPGSMVGDLEVSTDDDNDDDGTDDDNDDGGDDNDDNNDDGRDNNNDGTDDDNDDNNDGADDNG